MELLAIAHPADIVNRLNDRANLPPRRFCLGPFEKADFPEIFLQTTPK